MKDNLREMNDMDFFDMAQNTIDQLSDRQQAVMQELYTRARNSLAIMHEFKQKNKSDVVFDGKPLNESEENALLKKKVQKLLNGTDFFLVQRLQGQLLDLRKKQKAEEVVTSGINDESAKALKMNIYITNKLSAKEECLRDVIKCFDGFREEIKLSKTYLMLSPSEKISLNNIRTLIVRAINL